MRASLAGFRLEPAARPRLKVHLEFRRVSQLRGNKNGRRRAPRGSSGSYMHGRHANACAHARGYILALPRRKWSTRRVLCHRTMDLHAGTRARATSRLRRPPARALACSSRYASQHTRGGRAFARTGDPARVGARACTLMHGTQSHVVSRYPMWVSVSRTCELACKTPVRVSWMKQSLLLPFPLPPRLPAPCPACLSYSHFSVFPSVSSRGRNEDLRDLRRGAWGRGGEEKRPGKSIVE